ncbi:MAG: hypothetical protein ASARMPREDX12_003169 [Alectoria sarmentosa]|nr:MAG: hypothetical protein ASARMPREDX12_003169 [Alectoria sarmentosa]
MPTAYEIRAGGDVRNKKQSMADLKLRRLNELNSRLREDLERPRIKVSEASMSLIQYCTNTKDFMVPSMWGSFAQELLSTFSTSLGEVSLIPATGGVFTVDIVCASAQSDLEVANGQRPNTQTTRLWDRRAEGGFPGKPYFSSRVRSKKDRDPSFLHVRNPISFTHFDLFSAKFLEHLTLHNLPDNGRYTSSKLILLFFLTEVKQLKQLVRNVVDPTRDLGHVDRDHKQKSGSTSHRKSSSISTGQLSTEKAKESVK